MPKCAEKCEYFERAWEKDNKLDDSSGAGAVSGLLELIVFIGTVSVFITGQYNNTKTPACPELGVSNICGRILLCVRGFIAL